MEWRSHWLVSVENARVRLLHHGSLKAANGCFEQAGVNEYVAEFVRIRASAGSLTTSATGSDGALDAP